MGKKLSTQTVFLVAAHAQKAFRDAEAGVRDDDAETELLSRELLYKTMQEVAKSQLSMIDFLRSVCARDDRPDVLPAMSGKPS